MCGPTSEKREIGDITKLKPDARQTEKKKREREKERRGTYRVRHKLRL